MKRHFLSIVASCVLLVAMSTAASAAGFALYEWSARGNALGGTLVGRADDPSAVAFNPAGITQLDGTQIAFGTSLAAPFAQIDTTDAAGNQSTISSNPALFPIPHFYFTHKINDKWSFGIGEFSRFGLGFGYDSDWAGRFNIIETSILSASLNPNIAYKITDRLSVALGIEYVYVSVGVKKDLPPAAALVGTPRVGLIDGGRSHLEGSGDGYALTAGLHYKLDNWRFGVGYHSQAKVKASGDTKITGAGPGAMLFKDGEYTTKATVVLPDMISFGVTYYPTQDLSIEVGAINTRWSTYRNFDLDLDVNGVAVTNEQPKKWKDVWRLNLGVEYAIDDAWTVRGSYAWDEAPENAQYVDYMIPAADRHLIGTGVGYKYGDWTFDVAYTFIIAEEVDYDEASKNRESGVLPGKSKNGVTHIGAFTVGYSF
ncbi:MAG: OmpP1/FadL family transporter [Desulfovibrionales bacterium]|nr:OmpP1/FadL family transporter [Desulfovibrionales bacterium]